METVLDDDDDVPDPISTSVPTSAMFPSTVPPNVPSLGASPRSLPSTLPRSSVLPRSMPTLGASPRSVPSVTSPGIHRKYVWLRRLRER